MPLIVCDCSLNLPGSLGGDQLISFHCENIFASPLYETQGPSPQHCFKGHRENGGKSHLSGWDGEVIDKILCTCSLQVIDWGLPQSECAVPIGISEDICSGI